MATSEERLKILRMIEEKKITPEEGARLLKALARGGAKKPTGGPGERRWLRVRVTDMRTGKTKVNINLPFSLVDVGLRIGARFVPDLDSGEMEELAEALREGLTGKVVDVMDEEEGERVEIFVE